MSYDTVEDKPAEKLKGQDKLQRFKDWLRLSAEAEAKQRKREQEDLEFQVPENQWSEQAKADRAGRPMLSISLLQQPLQLVKNQASAARLGVTLTAVNEEATDELAEIKQGLYMRIQRDGLANQARMWALDRAIQAGRGWYRICTQYDEDSDNASDQEIVFERILYQDMVYPDPAAKKPDFSDARFMMIAGYVPHSEFCREYPKAEKYGSDDFLGLERDPGPEWTRVKGDGHDPLVVEVFYKEAQPEEKVVKGTDYKRPYEKAVIRRAVFTGCEVLREDEWPGHYIPVITVIGRELQPVRGERRWEGMVRPTRDAQKVANYGASSVVEDVGRISKAPYVGAAGQFAGFEKDWLESNIRNLPYLEYNTKDVDQKPVPPPMPMQIDGTKMQLSLQLWQEARQWAQITTAIHDPSLGNITPGEKGQSGRAILALQEQADAGTGNYTENLVMYSMPYEARVILDLMPVVYDRPGRVTQVLGDEDKASMVMLNAPYVMDQRGRPVPAQPGDPNAKMHDLSKGKYSIAASAGKSFQTRLQQGQQELGELIPTLPPELQMVLLPTYMRFRDSPGAKEVAELLTKFRDQQFPYLAQKEGEQPTPEQLQNMVTTLQAQLQQANGQLQEAAEAIKTDQAKQQAQIQKAEIDAESKAQLERFQAAHETALQQMKQSAESMLQAQKLEFERWKTQFEAAHDVGMAAAGGSTSKVVRDRGQSNEREDGRESSEGQSREPERDEADV